MPNVHLVWKLEVLKRDNLSAKAQFLKISEQLADAFDQTPRGKKINGSQALREVLQEQSENNVYMPLTEAWKLEALK